MTYLYLWSYPLQIPRLWKSLLWGKGHKYCNCILPISLSSSSVSGKMSAQFPVTGSYFDTMVRIGLYLGIGSVQTSHWNGTADIPTDNILVWNHLVKAVSLHLSTFVPVAPEFPIVLLFFLQVSITWYTPLLKLRGGVWSGIVLVRLSADFRQFFFTNFGPPREQCKSGGKLELYGGGG